MIGTDYYTDAFDEMTADELFDIHQDHDDGPIEGCEFCRQEAEDAAAEEEEEEQHSLDEIDEMLDLADKKMDAMLAFFRATTPKERDK